MYVAFALLLFLGNLSIETNRGTIIGGDIASLAMVVWGFAKSDLRIWLLRLWRLNAAIGFYLAATIFFDLWNRVPSGDLVRGFARNVIFVASLLGGLSVIRCYGLRGWAWLLFWMTLGAPICDYNLDNNFGSPITNILKYGEGGMWIVAIPLVIARFSKQAGALALGALSAFVFVNSCRGWTLMGIVVMVGTLIMPLKTSSGRFRVLQAVALLAGLMGLSILVVDQFSLLDLVGDDSISDQARSTMQRNDLILDAWNYFLQYPLTGIGSWQQALNYVDILGQDELLGVHSAIVQLACEYGLTGLIYATLVIIVIGFAMHRIAFNDTTDSNMVLMALIWSVVIVGYNFCFSPFNGNTRFYHGFMLSSLVSLLLRSEPVRSVLKPLLPEFGRTPKVTPAQGWARARD